MFEIIEGVGAIICDGCDKVLEMPAKPSRVVNNELCDECYKKLEDLKFFDKET